MHLVFELVSKTFKIFISSTMNDLKIERELVKDVINAYGGMSIYAEGFKEFDSSSESVIKEKISECDGYIGIFDKRYGFIPPENNPYKLAISHLEYNMALKLNLPRFILKSDIKDNKRDTDNNNHKLSNFLNVISHFHDGQWIYKYNGLEELKHQLEDKISFLFERIRNLGLDEKLREGIFVHPSDLSLAHKDKTWFLIEKDEQYEIAIPMAAENHILAAVVKFTTL